MTKQTLQQLLTERISDYANSVSPPPMAAIARANDPWKRLQQQAITA